MGKPRSETELSEEHFASSDKYKYSVRSESAAHCFVL